MGKAKFWCSLVVNGWKTGKAASRHPMISLHLWFWFQALWISALSLFLCYYASSWLFVSISSCLSFWVAFLMQRSGFFGSETGETLQYLELLRKSDLICEWFYWAYMVVLYDHFVYPQGFCRCFWSFSLERLTWITPPICSLRSMMAGLRFSLVGLRFWKTSDLRYQQFLSWRRPLIGKRLSERTRRQHPFCSF